MFRLALIFAFLIAQPSLAEVRHLNGPSVTRNGAFSIVLQEMFIRTDFFLQAKLTHADEEKAFPIIADFVSQFRELSFASAHGLTEEDFLARQDALVRKTRLAFRQKLSTPGLIRLDAFIREQTSHIRVNVQPTES